jgi:hypothetical protein
MSSELNDWIKTLDKCQYDVDGNVVTCWFGPKGTGRRHAVRLTEVEAGIRIEATIATARILEAISMYDDPHRWAWRRNKARHLVGFRVDAQQRLIAEAVAPNIALTKREFITYLHTVAAEADRMELVLTGQDVQ